MEDRFVNLADDFVYRRGYRYYNDGNVKKIAAVNDHEWDGTVEGSAPEPYSVHINTDDPYQCYCPCAYAEKHLICKHMIALYLEANPVARAEARKEALEARKRFEEKQAKLEEERQVILKGILDEVDAMSLEELKHFVISTKLSNYYRDNDDED